MVVRISATAAQTEAYSSAARACCGARRRGAFLLRRRGAEAWRLSCAARNRGGRRAVSRGPPRAGGAVSRLRAGVLARQGWAACVGGGERTWGRCWRGRELWAAGVQLLPEGGSRVKGAAIYLRNKSISQAPRRKERTAAGGRASRPGRRARLARLAAPSHAPSLHTHTQGDKIGRGQGRCTRRAGSTDSGAMDLVLTKSSDDTP